MEKDFPIKIADIGHINSKTRLEAGNLVREFEGIVKLFNRVLQFKERERLIFENKKKEMEKRIENNLSKINVLKINLSIYDQNNERISNALIELDRQEESVNKKYESMLSGKMPTDEALALDFKNITVQKKVTFEVENKLMQQYGDGISSRDGLIQRRRRYLEGLDNTFRRFDEELFNIDGVRNNLTNARSEIVHKKDKALNSKTALEANYNDLQEEKLKIVNELNESIEEESYILNEFRELVRPISKHLDIRPQTDHLLMQLNSEVEADSHSRASSNSEAGKGLLKVLENPVRVSGN